MKDVFTSFEMSNKEEKKKKSDEKKKKDWKNRKFPVAVNKLDEYNLCPHAQLAARKKK